MIDVAVVGAGLSGLVCARELRSAGASVTVLEARDRVGGRTLSTSFAGAPVDLGAQWISAGQPNVRALAGELGVRIIPQYRTGQTVIARPDRRRHVLAGFERWRRLRELERLSRRPDQRDHRRSLEDWLTRRVRAPDTREMIALAAELETGAAPVDVSLLYYVTALRASGGFGTSAEEVCVEGGTQTLSERLAGELGDAVRTGRAVRAIRQGDRAITVHTDGGQVDARFAVLALPPAQCAAIELEGRGAARVALERSMPLANVTKVFVAYREPFWRARGLSGEGYVIGGTARATVDACAGPRAALLAFVVGREAASWSQRSADERLHAVIDDLVTLFGDDAARPIDVLEHDWAVDPWAGGCIGNLGPGADATCDDAMRAPCGRVHYAGSEVARTWPRYLEGAIVSGRRAAAEVSERLAARASASAATAPSTAKSAPTPKDQ